MLDVLTNNLNISLSDDIALDQDLYYFKHYSQDYFLGVDSYDKKDKSYSTSAQTNRSKNYYKILAMHGFKKALDFILNSGIAGDYAPYVIPVDIEESWDWVPIKIYGVEGDFLATQELVDSFDPVKIKDNRILKAAKEEYEDEINIKLNSLLSALKREELKDKITNLSNRSTYIYNDATFGYLEINCFDENDKVREHEDEILSLIKEYIPRKDVKIIKSHKGFRIFLNRNILDKIKKEISDFFEVKL